MAGALAITASALIGVQLAATAPAAAVAGIQKVTGPVSPTDSQLSKRVHADCPTGTRVIGGGGWVQDTTTADAAKVALVELQPVHPTSGVDSYFVTGQEVGTNISSNWWVQAYAICASPVAGMHIVPQTSITSSPSINESDSFCPTGEVALGGGGKVNNPANHVSLTGAYPTATGDRISAAAAIDTQTFLGSWSVSSYAVCAPTPPGYQVAFKQSTDPATNATKVATITCPAGKQVHSAGMAIFNGPQPGLALQVVYPFDALDEVEASGVNTQAPGLAWNPVVAVAICAN